MVAVDGGDGGDGGGVEAGVDGVEDGVGDVEGRRPRLHREIDDEDDEAGEDEEDAEGEADDGSAPHRGAGPVPRLQDDLGRRRRLWHRMRHGWRVDSHIRA